MKKFFHRNLPQTKRFEGSLVYRLLGTSILHRDLWSIQRENIARGVAIGFFWACIPIPAQMLFATLCALIFRSNLAIGLALCWITNPVTLPFLLYLNYYVGTLFDFSGTQVVEQVDQSVFETINALWIPLGIGSLVVALTLAIIGYFSCNLLWRITVVRRRLKRTNVYKISNRAKSP